MDLYLSNDGDIKLSPTGDLAITENEWRDDSQQAYIRIMTEPGAWGLYPGLGAELYKLYGMAQSENTAAYGKALIEAALAREGRFAGKSLVLNAVPTGPQTIRFDVFIGSPSKNSPIVSIEQELGVQ